MKLFNKKIKNRKISKAKFLYYYIIISSIASLVYFIAAIILGLPKWVSLTPLYLLIMFIVYRLLVMNIQSLWLYIRDKEQGKLLLFLNKNTHWSEEHKMKVIKWVYLNRKTVRSTLYLKITKKVMDGDPLTDKEKRLLKYKVVKLPQQIKEGFNEALLVNALIYAHENIQVLDADLREEMNLTVDNIMSFDLIREYEKAGGEQYEKYMKIGKRESKKL